MNPDYIEGEHRRRSLYFIPQGKQHHRDFKISNHAVKKFIERFGNGNGGVRKIIKSVIDKGEVVQYKDEHNMVIYKDGVYAIITKDMVRTIYSYRFYDSAKERIVKNWERNDSMEEEEDSYV